MHRKRPILGSPGGQFPGAHGGQKGPHQQALPPGGAGAPPGQLPAYWAQTADVLVYGNSLNPAILRTGTLRTPLFDLRADLGQQSGFEAQATAVERVLFGIDLSLFFDVVIENYATVGADYRISMFEFGAAVNPADGDPATKPQESIISSPVDVTLAFNSGAFFPSAAVPGQVDFRSMLRVTPVGPLRYWGVGLTFDVINNVGSERVTRIAGALH